MCHVLFHHLIAHGSTLLPACCTHGHHPHGHATALIACNITLAIPPNTMQLHTGHPRILATTPALHNYTLLVITNPTSTHNLSLNYRHSHSSHITPLHNYPAAKLLTINSLTSWKHAVFTLQFSSQHDTSYSPAALHYWQRRTVLRHSHVLRVIASLLCFYRQFFAHALTPSPGENLEYLRYTHAKLMD